MRALYDRFDFKVCTHYVKEKSNRMKILTQKQCSAGSSTHASITLEELYTMQREVRSVNISDNINELADNILCELRRKEIPVTDRIYFNFAPVVQAEAWLNGRDTVLPEDMQALINYLWDKPEQKETISKIIEQLTKNPFADKIDAILAKAYSLQREFESAADKNFALMALRDGLLSAYEEIVSIKIDLPENDAAHAAVEGLVAALETVSREAHSKTGFTYVPLEELKICKSINA